MEAIDKTRTDPPDKEKGGAVAFPANANHSTSLTAYQKQSKDRFKGETAVVLPASRKQQQQQQQQQQLAPTTKTTTFEIDDKRFTPNAHIPHLVYGNQRKSRHPQPQRHQQPNLDDHYNHNAHRNSGVDEISVVLPGHDVTDLNSNTNQFSPPGTVDSSENETLDFYISQQNQQKDHEPAQLINSPFNDPKEYNDNSPSRGNQNKRNGQHGENSTSYNSVNSHWNNSVEVRKSFKSKNLDEFSVTSSGSVLSTVEQNPKLPFPRSSSPRLVQRQEHVEVPCDDVAIIDIENEDDIKVQSDDKLQPTSSTQDPGVKLFYIGDSEGTVNFDDDISRIISVTNSDVEITESSLVLPDVFSNATSKETCPTSGESSIRSSVTEIQSVAGGQKLTYRKQKKAAKKKHLKDTQDKNGDQTDEEPSRSSRAKSSRNSGKNSNWRRLRNTLKAANEMKSPKKQNHPLTREDSFLRKFSTRNHNNVQNSSTVTDEESPTDHIHKIPTWSKLVIQHDGNFMFYWLGVVTLSVMYNLWTCIAREGFEEIQTGCPACWYFMDGLFDIIYILDIVVQFRTGYLDQGLMVYDSKKLRQRYFSSKIIYIDFLCLLPLDFLQIVTGVHPMLRFPRFLKIYRAFRFLHMLESRTAYPNFIRVVSLTHILFLGAHWFAAFYYMISEAEGFNGDWSYPKPVGSFADVRRKYLKSLYWSTLTLTTIGDLPQPENANEPRMSNAAYVFVIVSYLIGVFVFATIVGQVGNVINNRNASRQEFERLLDGAKVYMQTHNVPQNLQKRVQRWYDYVWSRGRLNNGDINSLGLLPDKLKTELAIHVNLETLKKVTIFQECQPEFLHDLVLKMKAYIFTPGDLICRRGEVAREMFIIADGLVEIISETGTILKRMGAGDFFGEIGILNLDGGINRRSADVRSVGYLELFVLSRDDILGAMKDHPEAESIIRDYGQRRLREVEAHRQRVKPLKCQDNNVLDAPTGGQNVQNRLLMTLRSLSPAVRRQSSQLANAGRQSSLQTPPPPGSPGSNSKRCVNQKPGSRASSPSVKTGTGRSVRKTVSDFNNSSADNESCREQIAAKHGGYCEACGGAFDESMASVRGNGPRRYVSSVYSKLGNIFRKRMSGRRTRSVVYDTPPGMFRNAMWRNGEGDATGRLSLRQVKCNFCTNCNMTLRVETFSEDKDKIGKSNNSTVSESQGSSDTVQCDTNGAGNSEDHSCGVDTLQVCDDTGGDVSGIGSKIARVLQDKMGWVGNVSYTPVNQADPEEDGDVEGGVQFAQGGDNYQNSSDMSDNSGKRLLCDKVSTRKKPVYLRDRTQSLDSDVKSEAVGKFTCVKFSPRSTSSLEKPTAGDQPMSSIPGGNDVAETVNRAQHSRLDNASTSIQSFQDMSTNRPCNTLTSVPSQSHPDLTLHQSHQPQRRLTNPLPPPVVQYSPTSSSCSPVPHFLLPAKCMTTHQTLADDLLQTSNLTQHEMRNSEFSSILHPTTRGSQSRYCLERPSDPVGTTNRSKPSFNPEPSNVNETTHRISPYQGDPDSNLKPYGQNLHESYIAEQPHRYQYSRTCNSHNICNGCHQSNKDKHHLTLSGNREGQTRPKRRCKSCGFLGRRRQGLLSSARSSSIPDLLDNASFLVSLRMRRTSSLDEKLLSSDRITRQGSACRSDSISRDGSGKTGRSKAMSIMQTPTHDLAFQHLAEQMNTMQEMLDRRLTSIEEAYVSTTHRLDRLANSHEVLIRMLKKVIRDTSSTRADTQCEEVDGLHSSCV